MASDEDEINAHMGEATAIDPTSPEYANDPRYKYVRKLWVRSRAGMDPSVDGYLTGIVK